jgi:ATP-binding cassette, subfamily F, member 3
LLALNNFSFEFAGRYLYQNASWHIKPGERIGLVGKNGTGKSTLLRLINGDFELREGEMSGLKNLTIGFLNQDLLSFNSHDKIIDVAMKAFEKAIALQHEIDAILKRMEVDHSEAILNELGEKQEEFERLDGYRIRSKTEEVLEGLGFKTEDLERPLDEFSGGWRMRVILAQMLLQEPMLLMLDEPTNHLDLPSIEWLENYLQSYQGTVIVVSHDRYFVNRMVNKIVEITNQKIYHWTGNYDSFQEQKIMRDELQQRSFENQEKYIKEQQKFISRFRAKASKATAVQSRVKMLEKLDLIDEVEGESSGMNLSFKVKQQSGKLLSSIKHVTKAYGNQRIVTDTNIEINKGDKIALIGANGKGKSTVLRMIAGTESFEGEKENVYNVIESFYAQHQLESLVIENEILEELKSSATHKLESELRSVLGCFLFHGEDVFKKIKVLSGGEKARVALAKTLVSEANFLLLDEPTNHLDMQSVEILIDALISYEGTFVVVSHDRYFLSEIANKIWWIEDEKIKEYPGTYDEWETWNKKRLIDLKPVEIQKNIKPAVDVNNAPNPELKEAQKEKKQIESEIEKLESEIDSLKIKLESIEQKLTQPETLADHTMMEDLGREHKSITTTIQSIEEESEGLLEKLMEIEEQMELLKF